MFPRSGSTGLIHQRRTGETQQHRRCSNFWTHIHSFYISICLPTINVTFLIKKRSTLVVPWVKKHGSPFGQGTARVLPLFSLPTWLDGPRWATWISSTDGFQLSHLTVFSHWGSGVGPKGFIKVSNPWVGQCSSAFQRLTTQAVIEKPVAGRPRNTETNQESFLDQPFGKPFWKPPFLSSSSRRNPTAPFLGFLLGAPTLLSEFSV